MYLLPGSMKFASVLASAFYHIFASNITIVDKPDEEITTIVSKSMFRVGVDFVTVKAFMLVGTLAWLGVASVTLKTAPIVAAGSLVLFAIATVSYILLKGIYMFVDEIGPMQKGIEDLSKYAKKKLGEIGNAMTEGILERTNDFLKNCAGTDAVNRVTKIKEYITTLNNLKNKFKEESETLRNDIMKKIERKQKELESKAERNEIRNEKGFAALNERSKVLLAQTRIRSKATRGLKTELEKFEAGYKKQLESYQSILGDIDETIARFSKISGHIEEIKNIWAEVHGDQNLALFESFVLCTTSCLRGKEAQEQRMSDQQQFQTAAKHDKFTDYVIETFKASHKAYKVMFNHLEELRTKCSQKSAIRQFDKSTWLLTADIIENFENKEAIVVDRIKKLRKKQGEITEKQRLEWNDSWLCKLSKAKTFGDRLTGILNSFVVNGVVGDVDVEADPNI